MGIKLKNIVEKFDSKAQQRYLYATNPDAAKKKAGKMTKKDYKELPDKVNELVITAASISIIFKLIQKWAKKNPSLVNKLKDMVKKL